MSDVLPTIPARPLTLADLALLPDDGRRYELVDGSLLVSPPPSPRHQVAASRVYDRLRAAAPAHLMALAGGAGILARDDRYLIPDVLVVQAAAALADSAGFRPEDVVLVVEVVSPSNASHDLVLKRHLYAVHGIEHYWIVDIRQEPTLQVLRLQGASYVETHFAADERATLAVPIPVSLRPGDLLA